MQNAFVPTPKYFSTLNQQCQKCTFSLYISILAFRIYCFCWCLRCFHHLIVNRDQKCTGSDPCHWAGNTYRCISDDSGKPYCCSDSHNQFNHTCSKRCFAILHALDGCTVYCQQSKHKVKGSYNRQIHI